ncbi:MAG: 4Fe-4S binding protein [Candidatus Thorarchaeota archaeon]
MADDNEVSNPFFSEQEKRFRRWAREHPDKVYSAHPESLQEGFEYFFTQRSNMMPSERPSVRRIGMFQERGMPKRAIPAIMRTFVTIMRGIGTSWKETNKYLDNLELLPFEPQPELWDELNDFVMKKWDDVILGFTELPSQMIFKGKATLFKYAIVVGQEMKKKEIDKAPEYQAGKEVMRVYGSLGVVVNDIAKWLRKKGVRCQSNHPLGGLTNTPSLAGKAGMGWIGRNGLLITPEYGQRLRLAPVFVEYNYFDYTDNRDHDWIEEYCELCQRCEKECPQQAIYSEKVVRIENVPGVGTHRTCIDRNLCFDFFWKTMGCSVCVKVCPFSNAGETYERLKDVVERGQ